MRRALVSLAVFSTLLHLSTDVAAQTCPSPTNNFWKNDSLPNVPAGPLPVSVIRGLCEGEAIGTIFHKPGGMAPQKLTLVGVGFGHTTGGSGFAATCNLEIYAGPVTYQGAQATLGPKIFDLNASQGADIQLASTGINTFDVSAFNIVVNSDFVVAFRMNINLNGNCASGYPANFFTDNNGTNQCNAGINLIDEQTQGWIDPATATIGPFSLCPLFYAGNWVIRACTADSGTPASWTARNGSGVNPNTYTALTNPRIGTNWITTVDIVTPGAFASAVGVVGSGPLQIMTGLGELLIDISSPFLGGGPNIAAGAHSIFIPNDLGLIGVKLYTQAATIKTGPIIRLQNAIDACLGI